MQLRVEKNRFICSMLLILIMISMMLYLGIIQSTSDFILYCKRVVPVIVMLCTIQVIGLRLILPDKRILMYLVVVLYYIFHVSHVILNRFNYDFGSNERNNIYFRYSDLTCIEATQVALKAGIAIYIGFILFFLFYRSNQKSLNNDYIDRTVISNDRAGNLNFVFILVAIGLPADLYTSLHMLIVQRSQGYLGVSESMSTISYIIRVVSYLLITGVTLYVQNGNIAISKKKICLGLFVVYKMITMLSGLRAYALISILIVTFVYVKSNKDIGKIKLKHILVTLLILQVGGGIIVGIRETRVAGINYNVIFNYIFDVKSNIIFNMMGEFGITQNLLCDVLIKTGGEGSGGTQLFASFLTIIPWVSTILRGYDFKSAILETALDIHNYGGSYTADILFDFGKNKIIVTGVILGLLLAYVFEKYESNIQNQKWVNVAIYTPIIIEFIYCVRSSLAKMPRMIVWYVLLIWVLKKVAGVRNNR